MKRIAEESLGKVNISLSIKNGKINSLPGTAQLTLWNMHDTDSNAGNYVPEECITNTILRQPVEDGQTSSRCRPKMAA